MNAVQLKQNGRFYYGWVIVLLGFLLMSIAYVGFVSLTSVFVLPVTEDLGFSRGDFATYNTILSFACIVISPIAGRIMTKRDPRWVVALGCLLGFVGYLGFSRSSALWAFYGFSFLLGAGFAMTAPTPVSIMINNWFGGKVRGRATGIAFVGSGIGGMVLAPVFNAVIEAYSWRTAYFVLGCVFLVVLLPLIMIFYVNTPEAKGFTRMGATASEQASLNAPQEAAQGLSLKEATGTPELWLSAISAVLMVFASSAILTNDVSFFVECGVPSQTAVNIHGLMLGSLLIGKPVIGAVIDRFGLKWGGAVSILIFAATFVSFCAMSVLPALACAVVVAYCLGAPAITIVPPLTVNEFFGEKDYGAIVGFMNTATCVGGAFGGMVGARVFDATGSYVLFWVIAAVSVTLSAILLMAAFFFSKRRK